MMIGNVKVREVTTNIQPESFAFMDYYGYLICVYDKDMNLIDHTLLHREDFK